MSESTTNNNAEKAANISSLSSSPRPPGYVSDHFSAGEEDEDTTPQNGSTSTWYVEQQNQDDKNSKEVEVKSEENTASQNEERIHIVTDRQTLNSIAAMYDTTPSKVAARNRITSFSMLFPGQKLTIPPPEPPPPAPPKKPEPKPVVFQVESEIFESQFVKFNCQHITEGRGNPVGGLLLAPKTIMFNANETDPLVVEHERRVEEERLRGDKESPSFQIIAPCDLVVNYAIFDKFVGFNSSLGLDNEETDRGGLYVPTAEDERRLKQAKPTAEEDERMKLYWTKSSTRSKVLYLRLVMGKPIAQCLSPNLGISSYGDQTMLTEYWFMIEPKTAVYVHRFARETLEQNRYGLINHMTINRWNYEVIRPGTQIIQPEAGQASNRESIALFQRKQLTVDTDTPPLEMLGGTSLIVKEASDLEKVIRSSLPMRAEGKNLELLYSTEEHGYSLNSMYKCVKRSGHQGAALMLITDCAHTAAFGVYLTEVPFNIQKRQGTGETFVFSLRPRARTYKWTGGNEYFYRADLDQFGVGNEGSKYAIWFDENIEKCTTAKTGTFDNEPLAPYGEAEPFDISQLEIWAFI